MEWVACERLSYGRVFPALPPVSSPWSPRLPSSAMDAMDVFLAIGVEMNCMHLEAKVSRIFTFVLFFAPLLCNESGTAKTGEPFSAWGLEQRTENKLCFHTAQAGGSRRGCGSLSSCGKLPPGFCADAGEFSLFLAQPFTHSFIYSLNSY